MGKPNGCWFGILHRSWIPNGTLIATLMRDVNTYIMLRPYTHKVPQAKKKKEEENRLDETGVIHQADASSDPQHPHLRTSQEHVTSTYNNTSGNI